MALSVLLLLLLLLLLLSETGWHANEVWYESRLLCSVLFCSVV